MSPMLPVPPVRRQISRHAAGLRRDRTEAEKRFLAAVRNRRLDGFKFRFQASIGPFVVDFLCVEARLIVELDGGQHSAESDAARTRYLEEEGYRVMRFWNNEVFESLDGVLAAVAAALHAETGR